jgi:hypothetical protein
MQNERRNTAAMDNPLSHICPVCGALPNDPCIRMNGTLMPGPHSKRKHLALGIKTALEDVNQAAARIVREATKGP